MRRTPTTVALTALLALPACYQDHGAGREPDASGSLDASGALDASPVVPDARAHDAGVACAGSRVRVTVVREALGVHRCEGETLTGRMTAPPEPAPEIDGLRLALDLCPDADADCRCVLHVGGIGDDIARYWLEEGPFEAQVGPSSIVLVATHPGGEASNHHGLALYAHDGALEGPSFAVPGVRWRVDAVGCPESPGGACRDIGYAAEVTIDRSVAGYEGSEGGSVRLLEGETARVPRSVVTARLLRATQTVCAPASPPDAPDDAAFVVWWEYPPAP